MSKPDKKPKKVNKGRVVSGLTKQARDWEAWLDAGLPKRPNITKAQLAHRIALVRDALALLTGGK